MRLAAALGVRGLGAAWVLASVLGGCRSIPVTPAAIERAEVPDEERQATLAVWREAIEHANVFLVSPFNRTLPAGRYELGPDGMRFLGGEREWPIEVRNTTWGDLVLATGFQAQERAYGFCVGDCPPERDPVVDNALFRTRSGERLDADSIARLVLHETAHVVAREGTVGFWNSLAFYAEAVFLLRSRTHSDEAIPYAVSEEFVYFRLWRDADEASRRFLVEAFEERIRTPHPLHRHGPIPIDP